MIRLRRNPVWNNTSTNIHFLLYFINQKNKSNEKKRNDEHHQPKRSRNRYWFIKPFCGLMNLRLDVVLSDITGKSGMAIINAIVQGERDGNKLSKLADRRVRKSKEEIANALQGHWSEEYLYELKDCLELYELLQTKIQHCNQQIEGMLIEFTKDSKNNANEVVLTKKQVKGKNQPRFDLTKLSYQYLGVDLFAIEGVSVGTVLTLITEIGTGIYKFNTAKKISSFLRLAPNNRVSGGKLISSRTPKGANKLALALRNAANTIDRKKKEI